MKSLATLSPWRHYAGMPSIHAAILCSVFAISGIGYAAPNPPTPSTHTASAKQQEGSSAADSESSNAKKCCSPPATVVLNVNPSQVVEQQTQHQASGNDHGTSAEWWIAGATVALVIVTMFLAYFTYRLWEDAKNTFISTNRPKLRVRHVWPKGEMWGGGAVDVTVQVVNIGITKARLTKFSVKICIALANRPLPSPPAYEKCSTVSNILKSGESADLPSIDKQNITDEEHTAIRNGEQLLYCFGYIIYADSANLIRTTAFCRVLELSAGSGSYSKIGRFIKLAPINEDYEYDD